MSNLDNIIEKIKSDARDEAQQFLADAQGYVDRTIKNAEAQAAARVEGYESRATENSKLVRERVISGATQSARDSILTAKQGLIERVAQLAKDALRDLPDNEFGALVDGYVKKHPLQAGNALILPATRKSAKVSVPSSAVQYDEKLESGFQILQEGIKMNFDFDEIVETLKEDKAAEIVAWSLGEKEAR